jgi:hypothetical protein
MLWGETASYPDGDSYAHSMSRNAGLMGKVVLDQHSNSASISFQLWQKHVPMTNKEDCEAR